MPSVAPFEKFLQDVCWAKTPFGPMEHWDPQLRYLVRLMMTDTSPVSIMWGNSHAIIYNEAYLPVLGENHPHLMGKNAPDVFPEFWDYFETVISEQRRNIRTEQGKSHMLLMKRHGYFEELYFDWKLIPIVGDDGEHKGCYGISADKTREVVSSRQNDCLRELTHHTAKANNMNELWEEVLTGLNYNDKDIPFALLYSLDEHIGVVAPPSKPHLNCNLEGYIGVNAEHVIAKQYIDLQHDKDGFAPAMLEALKTGTMMELTANDPRIEKLLIGIDWKGHQVPSEEFVVVPVKTEDRTVAFFIFGINPYRRLQAPFREFLQLAAEVVAPQILNLRLAQEVERRHELATRAQLDFKRSEMRFTRFAERSIVSLAISDVEGRILYANDAWYKFSGLSPSDQHSLSWVDSVIPEDIDLLRQWQDQVLNKKKGGTFQVRSKEPFRQGQMYSDHRTGICACYSDLNEAGEVESVMILIMDISELKWTEQQLLLRTKGLEESERKYRNYAEHCPLGIVRTDGEGYVQYGNDAWRAFYGFTPDQVLDPQPWLKFLEESDVQPCIKYFAHLQKHRGPESIELQLKNKTYTITEDGKTATNSAYIVATGFSEFKEDGTVDHIDFWVTDISGQKIALEVLRDKMEEAIRVKTQQERFMDMISHEIRNPLSAVLHCSEEVIDAMKKASTALDFSFGGATPGDSAREVLKKLITNTVDAANTVVYCVQHQKQIVDDVLTVSKLDSDLLMVSPVPVQPMALVRSSLKIFEAELRMTDINLSIIEDNSLAVLGLGWVLLDPNRFLQIVINLVTNAIKFTKTSRVRKITVTVSALTSRPPASQFGVEYVPLRYTPANPVISLEKPSSTGDINEFTGWHSDIFLSFSVKDTGKGLKNNEKALLFNRFAQANPKTHIEYGGSGLGLFISRQITEMLGGEIGMASEPGSGCTFAFYVKTQKSNPPLRSPTTTEPLIRVTRSLSLTADGTAVVPLEVEDATTEILEDKRNTYTRSPRKVLVVEDNLVNQKVLCKQLRNRDFVVQTANHGRDAIEVMTSRNKYPSQQSPYFDVVLCDIEMPVMDGIKFTEEVRRLEADNELRGHIPIIGVTANVRCKQISIAIEAGMDGVTTKPYRIQELIAHIDRVCSPDHQEELITT
ncbi:hypothetical protein F5B20DRAFT_595315 [Whalleya microplaca]|nr:hypothetical protein F5B20DRAFT_595315 [Whalleya microplaca]